jgi:Holliday junction resolvasome RuvABC DNA-binding subunit
VEAERKRVADQEAKAAAEVERREANRRHCAKVNRAVVVELMALGLSEQQAKSVVTAIAKSEIANLRIAY